MSVEESSDQREIESGHRKKTIDDPKKYQIFHQSSSSKKQQQSQEIPRNPYTIFIEDSESKILASKEKSAQKSKFEDVTPVKSVNFVELYESSSKEFTQNELEVRYLRIIDQIKNETYSPIVPFKFYADQNQKKATKFLCFQLNQKNGRLVRYQANLGTCSSFFRCQGCRIEYSKASALGGHLSKCSNKKNHYQKIYGTIPKIQHQSEECYILNQPIQPKIQDKSNKKDVQKKKNRNHFEAKKQKKVLRVQLSQLLAKRNQRVRSSSIKQG